MKSHALRAAALLLALSASGTVAADDNFGLGVRASTLGAGVEGTWRPVPWIDFRLGYNFFDYDTTTSEAGINYDATAELSNAYGTANIHFPLSPMRLSVGAFNNSNELVLRSTDAAAYDIGALVGLTPAEVGTLSSTTTFDEIAPYLGVGFDFTFLGKAGINLDLGVLWQGEPRVALSSTGTLANAPIFQTQLEAERLELADELSDYKAYPVVGLGFYYNF